MIVVQPPDSITVYADRRTLFLAGSIDMDKAERWQDALISQLQHTDWVVLNPRRAQWDGSWAQSIDNRYFVQQVEWELVGQELATKVLLYFAPGTQSPISLLELGLAARYAHKVTVVCPPGFWRKGNVDVT